MGNESRALIIAASDRGHEVCAAASRISTMQGSALSILERGRGPQKDLNLILKVLGSGHKSVLEHHVFTVAFDNVSVLVEQFLI